MLRWIPVILAFALTSCVGPLPEKQVIALNQVCEQWPILGYNKHSGLPIKMGGLSGLFVLNDFDEGCVFVTVPDRGPNGDALVLDSTQSDTTKNVPIRPFMLPDYQASIVHVSIGFGTGAGTAFQIPIFESPSTPTTGFSPQHELPVQRCTDDPMFIDSSGTGYCEIPARNWNGGDFEGLVVDKRGNFWLCDEYYPALMKYDPQGQLQQVVGAPKNHHGLPVGLLNRCPNRGFEGLAYDATKDLLYAFIQSPLCNDSLPNQAPVTILDAENGTHVGQLSYPFEGFSVDKLFPSLKIGDAAYVGNNKFWVIERNSAPENHPKRFQAVFEVELVDRELTNKRLVLDLMKVGLAGSGKPEGIAVLKDSTILILEDNDFGPGGNGISDDSNLWIYRGPLALDGQNNLGQ